MSRLTFPTDRSTFSENLFRIIAQVNPGVNTLEFYEFQYGLDNLTPPDGWGSVSIADTEALEQLIGSRDFYEGVQLSPRRAGKIVLDEGIIRLAQMVLVGLESGAYAVPWVVGRFYFDLRSFLFFPRTQYYTPEVLGHFGGQPWLQFCRAQAEFEGAFDLGYQTFRRANREIDGALGSAVLKLATSGKRTTLFALAGPSGSGKTEFIGRLRAAFNRIGLCSTTVEMDHFYKDREFRDRTQRHQDTIHFDLFQRAMEDLLNGKSGLRPEYDFYKAVSSHDLDGNLRPGAVSRVIEPADVVFLEGNFPFQIDEVAPWVGIKIIYLTDDPIRLKRKWKRDIDYRKKYEVNYFCNRFFRTQFLRADEVYRPLMAVSDLVVDTTMASLWATPQMIERIGSISPNSTDLDEWM